MNQATEQKILLKRDIGPCSECRAPKGHACRRMNCPQLQPVHARAKGPTPELLRLTQYVKAFEGGGPTLSGFGVMHLFKDWHIQYPAGRPELVSEKNQYIVLCNDITGDRFRINLT